MSGCGAFAMHRTRYFLSVTVTNMRFLDCPTIISICFVPSLPDSILKSKVFENRFEVTGAMTFSTSLPSIFTMTFISSPLRLKALAVTRSGNSMLACTVLLYFTSVIVMLGYETVSPSVTEYIGKG